MKLKALKWSGYLLVAFLLALFVLQPDGGHWIWLAFLPPVACYGSVAIWIGWRLDLNRWATVLWPWALGRTRKKLL